MVGVALINPKYAHNVGQAIRAASCYGVDKLWYTGKRVEGDLAALGRMPREERMRGYRDVDWSHCERFFDSIPPTVTPVAVEFMEGAESLYTFEHPEQAVYVFGPEDGGITQMARCLCHRFVKIPSVHCLNLSAAVYTVLYDRAVKEHLALQTGG